MGWFSKKTCISEEDKQILKEAKQQKDHEERSKKREILNGAIRMICKKAALEFEHSRIKPFEIGDKVCLNLFTSKYSGWWGNPYQYKFVHNYGKELEVVDIIADTNKLRDFLENKYDTDWWDTKHFSVLLTNNTTPENLKNNINITYGNMVMAMIKDKVTDSTVWSIKLDCPATYHIYADYFVKAESKTHKKIQKLEQSQAKLKILKNKIEKLEKQLRS